MTAYEVLTRACRLEDEIFCEQEQLALLRSISDTRKTEDIIIWIVDLEREIDDGIRRLAVMKKEIGQMIRRIPDSQYRMLLRLRYLCRWPWRKIAAKMNYSGGHVYRVHKLALAEYDRLLKEDTK